MLVLCLAAFAGLRPEDAALARLAPALRSPALGDVTPLRFARPETLDAEGLSVVVEGCGLGTPLARAGFAVEAETLCAVQVFTPYVRLRELGGFSGVIRVREPWRATSKVTTEGYAATMEQDWHESGVTGKGVRVAVVDVGFAGLDELMGTEIPSDIDRDFSRGDATVTEHGTAVTEILYDFAPEASFVVASFSTDVELGELLEEFEEDKVDVVNASIGFDNVWHADGTSSLTVYADAAVDAGIAYFAAAGNENTKYRVGALAMDDDGATVTIGGEPGVWVLTSGGYADVSFRWSEPFGAAGEDIDLHVFNEDFTECGRSEDYQRGDGWPFEYVAASGCSEWVLAVPVRGEASVNITGLTGYLYGVYGIDEDALTNTEDLTLPGDLRRGISVGAYFPENDAVADYSSRGPTNDGRTKPDVVAPTGVSTATYRAPFHGSSSATPHAAGLGVLWVDATGGRGDPADLKEWMVGEVRDLGDAGKDNIFGAGALSADEIPDGKGLGCGCAATPRAPWAWLGVLALARRRRWSSR